MDTLTRAMREAADEAPTSLDVGDAEWPARSWRSGRRRRAVRSAVGAVGVAAAAAAALVVALVASGVGGMPSASVPADGSSRSQRVGVTAYPQRIGHQWWVRDLPARPGPVAAVVQAGTPEEGTDPWDVVTARGIRYRLPTDRLDGTFPAISPDGTRVGWLADHGPFVVQDLLTGRVTRYEQLGTGNLVGGADGRFVGGRPYGLQMQSPGFFSASGSLALLASRGDSAWGGVLVLQEDGSATEVPGMGQAGGWLDDDRLLGRLVEEQRDAAAAGGDTSVELVVWDRRTGRTSPLARVDLPPPAAGTVNSLYGQFWGTVRADGTLWVTYSVEVPNGSAAVNQQLVGYALPSGRRVDVAGRPAPAAAPAVRLGGEETVTGQRFWQRTAPLGGTSGDVVSVFPVGRADEPIVAVQSAAGVTQVIWAQHAIDGSPSWSLFGTSSLAVFWWWKEVVLVAVALGAYRWWLARRRRRRAVAR